MWNVTFTVADGEGHTGQVTVYLDGAVTITNVDAWADLAAVALSGMIEGSVVAITVSRLLGVLTNVAAPESDIELKGRFVFAALGTTKRLVQSIPTFLRSKLLPNTDQIDLTDPDVDTWVDLMVDGITVNATLIAPVDSEVRLLSAPTSAKEAYSRKRR